MNVDGSVARSSRALAKSMNKFFLPPLMFYHPAEQNHIQIGKWCNDPPVSLASGLDDDRDNAELQKAWRHIR